MSCLLSFFKRSALLLSFEEIRFTQGGFLQASHVLKLSEQIEILR